jgi:EpsI family protein
MARDVVRGAVIILFVVGLRLGGDRLSALSATTGNVTIGLSSVPAILGDWRGHDVEVGQAVLDYLKPVAMLSRTYQRKGDGAKADATGIYATDWGSIHSPYRCLVAQGWRVTGSREAVTVHAEGAGDLQANVLIAEKGAARTIVLYVFLTREEASTSWLAQVVRLAGSRGSVNRVACLAMVSADVGDRPQEEATAEAGDLLIRLVPYLREALLHASTTSPASAQ